MFKIRAGFLYRDIFLLFLFSILFCVFFLSVFLSVFLQLQLLLLLLEGAAETFNIVHDFNCSFQMLFKNSFNCNF